MKIFTKKTAVMAVVALAWSILLIWGVTAMKESKEKSKSQDKKSQIEKSQDEKSKIEDAGQAETTRPDAGKEGDR